MIYVIMHIVLATLISNAHVFYNGILVNAIVNILQVKKLMIKCFLKICVLM